MTTAQPFHNQDGQQKLVTKLLFVDDELNILSALKRLFRPLGYEILTALNGREGLIVLEQQSVDLVVSDMRMPHMDGSVFLEQVASRWPDTARILLTGYADLSSTIKAVNGGKIYSYISKPWEDDDIKLSVKRALDQKNLKIERDRLLVLTGRQNEKLKTLNSELEERVKARTGELQQTVSFLELAYQSLDANYLTTIEVFSNLIEIRDNPSVHSRHVAELAMQLGQLHDRLDKQELRNLRYAALLRNLGKIGFSDKLLNTPVTSMSSEEYKTFTRHPVIGEGVLMAMESLYDVSRLIRLQHEQIDGHGFPDRLSGDKIPVAARILKIVGDYNDLQYGRLLSKQISSAEALDYIRKNSGARYDADIVNSFVTLLGDHKQKKIEHISERCVKSNGLESGMVLSRDFFIDGKVLLLSKGNALNDGIINRIHHLEESVEDNFSIFILN